MAILGVELEERVATQARYRTWRWCQFCTEVSRGFRSCDCQRAYQEQKATGIKPVMINVPRALAKLLEATFRISTLEAVDALFLEHLPKLLLRHR